MAGMPTLLVKVARFNNTVNLANKNKATQLFDYSLLIAYDSRLAYDKLRYGNALRRL